MRFAVISDIHGNLAATESVFADIDQLETPAEVVICTGNVVGHASHPNEVVALLRDRRVETVRGNYDEAVANLRLGPGTDYASGRERDVDEAALRWTREHLSDDSKKFLSGMKRDARLQVTQGGRQLSPIRESPDPVKEQRRSTMMGMLVGGALGASLNRRTPRQLHPRRVLFVHGSPRDVVEYLYAGTPTSILQAVAAKAEADVIIHGHTHQASHAVAGGVAFIGVGSVGRSRTGGTAEYAVVEIVGQQIELDFRSLDYDVERETRDLESSGLPRELAEVLRHGSFPAEAAPG